MHSRWRYKICTCCFILGELKSFWNYKDFSIIFPPENLWCNLCITKVRILPLIPLSIKVFNPNILGFLFCTNNSLTWAVTIFASPNKNFTENSRWVACLCDCSKVVYKVSWCWSWKCFSYTLPGYSWRNDTWLFQWDEHFKVEFLFLISVLNLFDLLNV